MNITQPARAIAILTASIGLVSAGFAQELDLEDENNRVSYSVGANIGQNLMQQGLLSGIDLDVFIQGMRDQIDGQSQLSTEDMVAAIGIFQERMMAAQAEQQEAMQAQMDASRQEGIEFLAANAEREGVVELDSGLQYLVLESGADGAASPEVSDSVLAHYHGTLIDGTVFDSSVDRGQPATFGLSQVIPGWTEALQLMKVGDKWRLFIPSEMAYGEAGFPGSIPPNATLIFDVELLEIR